MMNANWQPWLLATLLVLGFINSVHSFAVPFRRSDKKEACDVVRPFRCPGSDKCIPLQYVCDGSPDDCPDNYDEDPELCTADKRQPIDVVESFFRSQVQSGNIAVINELFGAEAAREVIKPGGIEEIARMLVTSKNLEEFAGRVKMRPNEVEHLMKTLTALHSGRVSHLNISKEVLPSLTKLFNSLIETGFLTRGGEDDAFLIFK